MQQRQSPSQFLVTKINDSFLTNALLILFHVAAFRLESIGSFTAMVYDCMNYEIPAV